MKSYHLKPGHGLSVHEHDRPDPGPGQVLVRIRASSVGYRDVQVLAGNYPIPVHDDVIPGCEGTGEVVAVGEGVTRVTVGDRVAATVFPRWIDGPFRRENVVQLGTMIDGVWTEYAVFTEDGLVPIPAHLSYAEAATLPLAAVTAWNALTEGYPPLPGATVLTLGSGAVSLSVLQFAKLAGARVIMTTSSAAKAERLRDLGADEVVNYREQPEWSDQVRDLTDGQGVDRVVDATGPLEQSLKAVAPSGEVAFVGYSLSGVQGSKPIDPGVLFRSGAVVRRVAVGSRAHFEAVNRAITRHQLRPVIDRTFGFDEIPDALAYCKSGEGFGKVVIDYC
jgi:NADPH:quinone reductase-like Zn-dependent oxidoreductase